MRVTSTFISGVVAAVAVSGSANATVVYNTIDPFTTLASDTSGPGSVMSSLTGALWDSRTIRTTTSNTLRATTTMAIGSGSMVFNVTQVGALNTLVGTSQLARLDYDTTPDSPAPNFTNFTSLDFNFASTLDGVLTCKVMLSDAGNSVVERTLSGASGFISITLADFGGIAASIDAMGPLTIEFIRTSSNASGSLTITNLVANGAVVPAPGAVALLGAAGLVGSRRRRS
jgi:hypothetical protein